MNSPFPIVKNIHLADDDADDCLLFSDALKELNYQANLTISHDGEKLLLVLAETVPPPPHAIILDLNMPRKNGFECLREIRATEKLRNIPVIIFSTSSSQHIVDTTYSLGANYYVCKPRSFSLFRKAIKAILSFDLSHQQQPPKDSFFLAIN